MDEPAYNPDILTCLASLSNDEVFTPPKIVNEMLDLLPQELWSDKNAKFLDPVSKTGIFLREITKRLDKGLEKQIPNRQKRINHILRNQVFGIAITELTSLVSRRSLYCSKTANGKYSVCIEFKDATGNIKYDKIKHNWDGGRCVYCGASQEVYERGEELESHAYQFIHTENPEEIFNMKFDVIAGNPPYQLSDEGFGSSASPIYHKFIQQAKKLNPRFITMIVPARWYSGGKGLNEFRDEMLNDKRMAELHDFPDTSDCFPGVNIRGGVCYFLWQKDHNGACKITTHRSGNIGRPTERPLLEKSAGIFVRYNEGIEILKKVQSFKEESFSKFVSSRKPFGLPTNFSEFKLKKDKTNNIELFRFGERGFVSENQILVNKNLVKKYKVIVPKASPGDDSYPHLVLSRPLLAPPNSCCTETYIVMGPFVAKTESLNVISYLETRFVRFLILLAKNTQDLPKRVYSFVPIQDFSKSWTDEDLYKRYKLTKDEIEFIDSLVKPLNSNTKVEEVPDESEE
ncbi:Eco57I restriction-modification methylase domain-containing protein [Patescibacteria group bacterium]|nr:Eco57I restriction-modification methylase domain-containing protein [Patescibacteria group bacterium]